MGISLNDLSPKARQQVMAKVAIEQVRKMKLGEKPKKDNKYKAKKVEACLEDGTPFTFASTKEFDHYRELVIRQKAGEISDLQLQVRYQLVPPQTLSDGKKLRSIDYIADFVFKDADGVERVQDVKGYRNPASAAYRVFVLKKKLMKWVYNIEVEEI